MDAITIENLDVVFGQQQEQALALLDQGKSRQEIIDETGQVVGVDKVSMSVKQGEICVLMGLSGSGKSSLLRAVNGLNGSLAAPSKSKMAKTWWSLPVVTNRLYVTCVLTVYRWCSKSLRLCRG